MNRLERVLARAAADIEVEGLRLALVGGLAVSARSEPRFTRDVDLAVAVADDAQAEKLVLALSARGYVLLMSVEQKATSRLATVRLAAPGEGADGVVVDLLFASSGIEPEITEAAKVLELTEGLHVPVALTGHLLALKLLADDPARAYDRGDIAALLTAASEKEIDRARAAIALITARGYDRGRDLEAALTAALARR